MRNLLLWCLLCISGAIAQETPAPQACQGNTYGTDCASCGHCKTQPCNKASGVCSGGCLPGWSSSDNKCKTKCTGNTWGADCSKSCSSHCADLPCNTQNGACTTCKRGYTYTLCDQPCPTNKYGDGCASTCGQCKKGSGTCDKETGACPNGCEPGYTGSTCHDKCSSGSYGPECGSTCGKCQGTCHHVTGSCSNCLSGFQPSLCKDECQAGGWGVNCLDACSLNCVNSSACDKKNGACLCQPGYLPPRCTSQCKTGYYGQHCTRLCGHCLQASQMFRRHQFRRQSPPHCDHKTGHCSRCVDNRQMPLCHDCVPGKYGSTCSKDCGQCGGKGRCDEVTGRCLSSSCQPGWTTPTCDQKCPEGTYGQDCTELCGHCLGNHPCRHDNGVCERDCEEGYEGVLCKRTKESLVAPLVGSILAAAVLIAVAIVLSVWLIRRRSRSAPITESKEDITDMAELPSADSMRSPVSARSPESTASPEASQVSEAYQNMQFPQSNAQQSLLGPNSTYDRMDMSRKEAEDHSYESHCINKPRPAAVPEPAMRSQSHEEQDPVYQNAGNFRRPTSRNNNTPAFPTEPEATYGNI